MTRLTYYCLWALLLTPGVAWTTATRAQEAPRATLQDDQQLLNLLAFEPIRKELDLVEDQVKALNEVKQQHLDFMKAKWAALDKTDDPRVRKATMEELRSGSDAVLRRVREILLAHQRDRVRQMLLQRLFRNQTPLGKITNQSISYDLKITEKQRQVLREQGAKIEEKLKAKLAEIRKEIQAAEADAQADLLDVLTEKQRGDFVKLFEDPVDLNSLSLEK